MHRFVSWLAALVLAFVAAAPVAWAARGRPAPIAGPAACMERVTNGGFELGTTGWEVTTNSTFALVGTSLPHTGQQGAILGARDDAEDELSQEITLPVGNTATLTLWWYVVTEENTAEPWDELDIVVTAGGSTVRLQRITDDSPVGSWYQATLDVSAYAGQTVRLGLRASTDWDRPTDFYVDDVSVTTCDTGETTVTPTTTATATATPTATVAADVTATPTATATTPPDPSPHRVHLPIAIE